MDDEKGRAGRHWNDEKWEGGTLVSRRPPSARPGDARTGMQLDRRPAFRAAKGRSCCAHAIHARPICRPQRMPR